MKSLLILALFLPLISAVDAQAENLRQAIRRVHSANPDLEDSMGATAKYLNAEKVVIGTNTVEVARAEYPNQRKLASIVGRYTDPANFAGLPDELARLAAIESSLVSGLNTAKNGNAKTRAVDDAIQFQLLSGEFLRAGGQWLALSAPSETRTITRLTRQRWVALHNDGKRVTPKEVRDAWPKKRKQKGDR